MAQLIKQILDRKYIPETVHSRFKQFIEDQLEKTNDKYKAIDINFKIDEKESDNLQLSSQKLVNLMGDAPNANVENFLNKLKMAYLGNWEDKGRLDFNINQ